MYLANAGTGLDSSILRRMVGTPMWMCHPETSCTPCQQKRQAIAPALTSWRRQTSGLLQPLHTNCPFMANSTATCLAGLLRRADPAFVAVAGPAIYLTDSLAVSV